MFFDLAIMPPSTTQKMDVLEENKCKFVMNALENGWTVKKRKGSYVFSKKHEDRKEILKDGYLAIFLEDNMDFGALNKWR